MRRSLILSLLALVCLPAWTSEPGEPLDCSDWVFFDAGLTCEQAMWNQTDENKVIDNLGRQIWKVKVTSPDQVWCAGALRNVGWVELREQHDNGTYTLLARLSERCGGDHMDRIQLHEMEFDRVNGLLRVSLYDYCSDGGGECPYEDVSWTAKIQLTPLFEVLQSYAPTQSEFTFHVPVQPEGFPAVDHFDTYVGSLTNPIDFTKARPLQCGYPNAPPSVGDVLTVDDPLPDPEPGKGRYYVTAVTHQGQTRYGRKSSGGVLSGRDPQVLPECAD